VSRNLLIQIDGCPELAALPELASLMGVLNWLFFDGCPEVASLGFDGCPEVASLRQTANGAGWSH